MTNETRGRGKGAADPSRSGGKSVQREKQTDVLTLTHGPRYWFRVCATTRHNGMDFAELSVYSALVLRRRGKPASVRRLARMTRLDRLKTVPKALFNLSQWGLTGRPTAAGWQGYEPAGAYRNWFVMKPSDQLKNRFAYNMIALPAVGGPLTPRLAAAVPLLTLRPQKNNALIASWLRVSPDTVRRARRLLDGLDWDPDWLLGKKSAAAVKDAADVLAEDREHDPRNRIKKVVEAAAFPSQKKNVRDYTEKMVAAGYSLSDVADYWELVFLRPLTFMQDLNFWTWFGNAVRNAWRDAEESPMGLLRHRTVEHMLNVVYKIRE